MLKRYMYFVREFLVPHLLLLGVVFLTGIIAASASGLGVPMMVKYVFPLVFNSDTGATPEIVQRIPSLGELDHSTLLWWACASLPIMFMIRGFALWANAVLVNLLGLRILETLRMSVFRRVQELPVAFMEKRRKGDVLSRIVADTQNVQMILSNVANDLVKQPITALCGISAFITLLVMTGNGWLFFVNILFLALAAWPIITFGKRITRKALLAQQGLGELNSAMQQNLETQREVRAYAMEEREIAGFRDVSNRYCTQYVKLIKYQKALVPVMEIVTAIALAVLMVRGRLCEMKLDDFMAMAGALFFAFDGLKRAGNAFNRFNEAQGSLQRLSEILLEPNDMPEPENPRELPQRVRGEIAFRHVTFAYDEQHTALRDIDLVIPPGQIVGLVGPSGAGKTTFANLIPRFYDATQGAVEIDGINVKELRTHDLREQLSYVGQQALLFSGSIRENIGLGKPGASEQEIRDAADAAAVSSFLGMQSAGLDTALGQGGTGLSGGQRQRVAIARTFVKDAPILILDEATASLDAESERDIQSSLERLAQGRTTLIVAHRFSTIRHAHRILVFDHGRIIADGTHEQLYATCPLYKELYDRQGV